MANSQAPPASKYDVELTLAAKKTFTETDQMEVIDYTQRVLCIQRGRTAAYGALFHCSSNEKIVRWVKTWEQDNEFRSQITAPAILGPGQLGSKQLLTMLTKSRQELGRPFPSRMVSDSNGMQLVVQAHVGEGATSHVFAVSNNGVSNGASVGVAKQLKRGHETRATLEVRVLNHLKRHGITNLVFGELVTNSIIFFPKMLHEIEVVSRPMVVALVSLLEAAHKARVIHRDLRPENIMLDDTGIAYVVDWGCSCLLDEMQEGAPKFEGTFRFAGDDVLAAAIEQTDRFPEAKDDLESLLRCVLAVNSPGLMQQIVAIPDSGFAEAKRFWESRKSSFHFKELCAAASRLDYAYLKQQLVL